MSFNALLQTMTALNDVHDTLLALAEQKKHVLIQNQVDELMQIVAKEKKLLKQIEELDQQRIDDISTFMIEKGYKPNRRVTVSDLTKIIFDHEDKKALLHSRKQLLASIRNLRMINQINQQLIEQSLSYINYSIDLMSGPSDDEFFYHNPQQGSNSSNRSGLFDTRA